jgi:hypothetical protein
MFVRILFAALGLAFCIIPSHAADNPRDRVNYDEAKVGEVKLPDALTCSDGSKVTDQKIWRDKRRPELLELFASQMYGKKPQIPSQGGTTGGAPPDRNALGGLATRAELTTSPSRGGPSIHVLIYVPNGVKKPVPAFLGFNFDGNHTVHADPGITIREQWVLDRQTKEIKKEVPAESTRGASASRWQIEEVLRRGYATVTISRANIEPDYAEGWREGVRGHYLKQSGKAEFAPDEWGCIAAWAWALSRSLDVLEELSQFPASSPYALMIDPKRVIVHGHSRMGKTSLWAAAQDERFAACISNNSGEGGAAIARRNIGETTAVLNHAFPHWFCGNFKQYSDHPEKLPFDQHELIGLIAPRPVYVASASEDTWADPRGEFLAIKSAEPVYALFGRPGLGVDEFPGVDKPVGDVLAYHMRTGKHDVTAYDWKQYLDWADRNLRKKGE